MKFEVIQQDINQGRPGTGCLCPIGLAIKRHLPDADYIRVGLTSISIGKTMFDSVCYKFPVGVSSASKEPFCFELTEIYDVEEWE